MECIDDQIARMICVEAQHIQENGLPEKEPVSACDTALRAAAIEFNRLAACDPDVIRVMAETITQRQAERCIDALTNGRPHCPAQCRVVEKRKRPR